MYTPINWASPNNLKLIKEKRATERIEKPHADEVTDTKKGIKTKWIDTFIRTFTFRLKPSLEI